MRHETLPVLSAIVISHNDETTIARAVRSVVNQTCVEPFEVIVVVSGSDGTAHVVAEQFPQVKLVVLPGDALPGKARNAGLRVARGRYISFPGSHTELPPGSLAARLDAHVHGHTMVTGSTLNGTLTRAGWATYFIDHHVNLPGVPAATLTMAPYHCSYERGPLLEIGGFPEDRRTSEDTVVNWMLFRAGHRGYRDPAVQIIHHSPCVSWRTLLTHHFQRGRGHGRLPPGEPSSDFRHRLRHNRRHLVRDIPGRLFKITRDVWRYGGEYRSEYVRSFPLIVLTIIVSWIGMVYETVHSTTKGVNVPR